VYLTPLLKEFPLEFCNGVTLKKLGSSYTIPSDSYFIASAKEGMFSPCLSVVYLHVNNFTTDRIFRSRNSLKEFLPCTARCSSKSVSWQLHMKTTNGIFVKTFTRDVYLDKEVTVRF